MFPSPAHHLRLAFCVPGILHAEKSPSQIDADHALQTFRINTIGPMLVMKHFSDFLPRKASSLEVAKDEYIDSTGLPPHAIWATMSARVGSTTDNSKGGWYSYRASKAGVTSLTKTFDLWLRNHSGDKAAAVALHPGTVRTGLSRDYWEGVEKEGKLFEPDYAAGKLLEVVRGLYLESGRGRCWDWAGKEIKP
jgi:NAD(P)-dependent dehydrogenase (short-subunit alcohol dehydrogenase family)